MTGLEPAILESDARCLIHKATQPDMSYHVLLKVSCSGMVKCMKKMYFAYIFQHSGSKQASDSLDEALLPVTFENLIVM